MRLTLVALLLSAAAFAQPGPPPGAHPGRQMMPAPKNLKVLEPGGLMGTMRTFQAALGVKCEYCHVEGDFASDDNPHKLTARKMIVMERQINTNFPDGKMHVTCYTCHRGAQEPATAPKVAKDIAPTGKG
jgi:hypothetical protein